MVTEEDESLSTSKEVTIAAKPRGRAKGKKQSKPQR